MIPGHQGDDFDFFRLEPAQIPVLHQIVRMLVMAGIADVGADVVQQRRELQPFPFEIGQPVHRARLIENPSRDARDLMCMFRPVAAALRKLDDAAPADVGIAIGLCDVLAVPLDVVQHQAFAQREVAERDVARVQAGEDRVQQHASRHHQIGASRIQPGQFHPL